MGHAARGSSERRTRSASRSAAELATIRARRARQRPAVVPTRPARGTSGRRAESAADGVNCHERDVQSVTNIFEGSCANRASDAVTDRWGVSAKRFLMGAGSLSQRDTFRRSDTYPFTLPANPLPVLFGR